MTLSLTGHAPKAVTAYRRPEGGYSLQIGTEYAVIDDKAADKLGRYFLFDVHDGGGEPAADAKEA